jgi:hypothetical protein
VGRDHDDVGPGALVPHRADAQARAGDMVVDRHGADDHRRLPAPLRAREADGRADRDDLLARGLEAQAPQLAHVVLVRAARVVRDERQPLAGRAQGRDGLDRPRRRLVAHPQAAVEVEQQVVVAGDRG